MHDKNVDQQSVQECAKILKDWHSNWAVAVDCLESLHPISSLQPSNRSVPDKAARKLLVELSQQVPTAQLLSLRAPQAAQGTAIVDLPQMQSEYVVLQEAVRTLQQTLKDLDETCKQGMALAIARQQDMEHTDYTPQIGTEGVDIDVDLRHRHAIQVFDIEESQPPAASDTTALQQDSTSGGYVEITSANTEAHSVMGGQDHPIDDVLDVLEIWVLVASLCASLHKQLNMLVMISSSINLVTRSDEMNTYIALLKLQPYVDERLWKAVESYTTVTT